MTRVKLYTTMTCPFCIRAKRLLGARGIPFEEIDVGNDDALREEIIQRTGRRTVPQIFVDERSIGGFEELAALDAAGKLAELHEPAA